MERAVVPHRRGPVRGLPHLEGSGRGARARADRRRDATRLSARAAGRRSCGSSRSPDRVELFEIEPVAISSREIRDRVSRGESIDGLVPPAVAELIHVTRALPRRLGPRLHFGRNPNGAEATLTSLEQARRIASLAQEKLAQDVVILDMRPACSYTDYFVVCTGQNPRQTAAIYNEVHSGMKHDVRLLPSSVDGQTRSVVDRRGLSRRGASHLHSGVTCATTGSKTSGATPHPSKSRPASSAEPSRTQRGAGRAVNLLQVRVRVRAP